MNKKFVLLSLVHAFIAVAYIFGVIFLISRIEHIPEKEFSPIFGPAVMLLLFVFSAALMAILVFGRSVMMYIDNQKKEALRFLFLTLSWLFLFLISFFCYFVFIN
jgi:hypothetical protein